MREDKGKGKRRRLHKQDAERLFLFSGLPVGRVDCCRQRPPLGVHQSLICIRERHPMVIFHELLVKALGGFLLANPVITTSWLLASSVQLGGSNPASLKDWAHLLTVSKQKTGPSTSPETMVSATAGCLWRTIFRQSAQTGPMGSLSDPGGAGEP